ncbi:helix-turn-helix domain-containing protein [Mucilaginibacter mallensis]|nr:helix-turn-helix transcriptional regulator [Mucilaginibacter mallensis]
MAEATLHIGRKISKIRELRGMKQEALAAELGISQQSISKIEQSAEVDESALEKIAIALGVPVEGIKKFNEDAVFNIIGNTVNNHDQAAMFNYYPTFNPIDKLLELFEENKKLYQELLASEREKVAILRQNKV